MRTLVLAVETISPEEAQRILDTNNTDNRAFKRNNIPVMAADMAAGRWKINGESLKFDQTGRLLDGQNRLAACVKAGVPFETITIRGLQTDVFDSIDTGVPRSGSDVLYIKKEANPAVLASTIATFYNYSRGSLSIGPRLVGKANLIPLLNQHPGIRDSVNRITPELARLVKRSTLAFLHYVVSGVDQVKAEQFFSALENGENLEKGSPMLTLARVLNKDKSSRRHMRAEDLMAICIKAWNAFYEGRKADKLFFAPKREEFPTISGTNVSKTESKAA